MIKKILIPLDFSKHSDSATSFAIKLAKQTDAILTGLVILDIPGIERSIGSVPLGAIHYAHILEETKMDEAKDSIRKLLYKFKERCSREGIKHFEAEEQGSPSFSIMRESIYYDAVIVGLKTYFGCCSDEHSELALSDLLEESVTPIFGVPVNLSFPKFKTRTVIAFDGSRNSAKALQRFAQLTDPNSYSITIITSDPKREAAEFMLNNAEAYLASHSFNDVKKVWTRENIKEIVKNDFVENTDLFVLGAHSKSSFIDFMVGSLTKFLIDLDKKLLLIG